MKATISKWGNSLALRLPRAIAKELGIMEGTSVDIAIDRPGIMLVRPIKARAHKRRQRQFTEQELLASLTPAHFDREEMDIIDHELPGEFDDEE